MRPGGWSSRDEHRVCMQSYLPVQADTDSLEAPL